MKWTNEKTWDNSSIMNSSFISNSERFINGSQRGLKYVKSHIVPHLGGGECTINPEVMFQNNPH
jgi:hypothetical protein